MKELRIKKKEIQYSVKKGKKYWVKLYTVKITNIPCGEYLLHQA